MFIGKNINNLSNLTLSAVHAALAAGDYLKQNFGQKYEKTFKGSNHDFATEHDLFSEKMIIDFLKKEDQNFSFLSEEMGLEKNRDSKITWIIDPLDGTLNYSRSIPCFCVSIAAFAKELIVGVIYQPMTHELFVAEKGLGAYLNGTKIKVSTIDSFDHALLATGFPINRDPEAVTHFCKVVKKGAPIRRLGSAAIDLAYVAAGRFDGFWEIGLSPWDIAAGSLIIQEAGGMVTNFDLKPLSFETKTNILATNKLLHEKIGELLKP